MKFDHYWHNRTRTWVVILVEDEKAHPDDNKIIFDSKIGSHVGEHTCMQLALTLDANKKVAAGLCARFLR